MIALKDPLLRNATRAVMSVTSHESALKTLTPELPVSEEDKLHSNNKEELEEDKVLVTDVDNPVTSRGNALNLSVEEEDTVEDSKVDSRVDSKVDLLRLVTLVEV